MPSCTDTAGRLLEEAIAQRSRCILRLPKPLTDCRELTCTILECSSRGLVVESLEQVATGPHWLGQPVRGYFSVAMHARRQEETFYTFESRIRGAKAYSRGLARLGLAQPEAVLFGQRRKSLRVEPAPEALQEFLAWRYDGKGGFRRDAPVLKTSDFRTAAARLVNVSGGGLGLTVRAALAGERELDLAVGQRCIIHYLLREPRVPGRHEFWLVARIRHHAFDHCGQCLVYGLEFLASGCLDAKAGKIRWEPVADHAIPELADICYLWHLDRHRERLG